MEKSIVKAAAVNRQEILRKMPRNGKVIKGSLVWLKRECGKVNCRCQRGKKHISLYLSRRYKGKTQMTYIPKGYEKVVTNSVLQYKQFLKGLYDLSEINLSVIKNKGKF